MRRPEQARDGLVRAIDGERVLNEVIGPEREKIDLGREQVGGHRRRRNFDHGAERDVVGHGDSALEDVFARFLQEDPHASDFFDARDHRDEDAQVASRRRGEQSAQLCRKHLGPREAEPHAPKAEDRVRLVGADQVTGPLLSAEIVRSDDDRARREPLDDLAVGGRLLLLGRKLDSLLRQIQKLRPEQADTVGAVFENVADLARELDVRAHGHFGAVPRAGDRVVAAFLE